MGNKIKDSDYDISSINFHNRQVFLYGEIDERLSYKIVTRLFALDSIDKNKPITLFINTPGGFCSDGFSIIEAMEQVKAPIHTVILGEACSMGTFISIMGTKRFATKHSIWMAHDLSDYIDDYLQKAKDRIRFLDRYDKMLDNLYRKRTKLEEMEIEKAKHGELWLFANEMLKRGIIDQII